jgi:hypothetical protein
LSAQLWATDDTAQRALAIVNTESTAQRSSWGGVLHLYQGSSEQFIADAVQARLANQLADRFFEEFRYKASPS